MRSAHITLSNPEGFHMRPAGVFATAMAAFSSTITLSSGDTSVDGKSLMQIMGAGFKCGTDITVTCEGADEDEALRAAVDAIANLE